MIKSHKWTTVLAIAILCSSCASYHISTASLVEQTMNSQPERKTTLLIVAPFFIPFSVTGNSLRSLKVFDKNENPYNLRVTEHTSIRITKMDGKKKVFYLNTLMIKDSTITGKLDHFFGVNINPINLNYIDKIELQKH